MSIEAHLPQQNQTVDEFRARQITPEEAEAGILNDLFHTIVTARISRQVLLTRRNSPAWQKIDGKNRLMAQQAIEASEEFTGWISLPQRVPNYSIPTAASLVEAGHQASIELKDRLLETELEKLREQYPNADLVFGEMLAQAANLAVNQFRPNPNTTIKDLFTTLAKQKLEPAMAAVEEEKARIKAEEEQKKHKDYVNDMFQQNIRLVGFVVRRLSSLISKSGLDFEDAVAEGQIGLLRAIESYDPSKGTIGTYGVSSIKNAILNAIDRYSPIPRGAMVTDRKVRKFVTKFHKENGRYPSDAEISERLHIKQDTLDRTRRIMSTRQESMDAPTTLSEGEFADVDRKIGLEERDETILPEKSLLIKEEADEQRMLQEAIRLALEELPERDSKILQMRHMEGMSSAAIAGVLGGISRSRVSQIAQRSQNRFASLVQYIDLEANSSRIMQRQTTTLREYLKDIGISYATYRNRELGKGIRFKRADNESARGRGQILVNPIQQELIRKRLEIIKTEKKNRRRHILSEEITEHTIKQKTETIAIREIKPKTTKKIEPIPEGYLKLTDFLNQINIGYHSYINNDLARGLELKKIRVRVSRGAAPIFVSPEQQQIIRERATNIKMGKQR